ncbi:MAG TPA: tetratricopeptide repeat protein [Vicinamibacterales bacterium]|nr:tetratricopeptide repeat protein [Vicinamibacterales bacterium]
MRATALALAALLTAAPVPDLQPSQAARLQASLLAYNLDHDEALRRFRELVAANPDDSAAHRALASTLWMNLLFRRGAVTVDSYLGGFTKPKVDLGQPPPEVAAEFRREITRAIGLAQGRVDRNPRDAEARYELGAALGVEASYTATIEGRLLAGFKAARRAFDEQEAVLRLDPARADAALIVGTYRYVVSTLSFPMRWMAYVAGFGGGKDRGIRLIEEAAARGTELRTDARFALVLIYNRERRYDEALGVLRELERTLPRNRLVRLESGATALRAGRAADAERMLSAGFAMFQRDDRPKIPGEAALWQYKLGAARARLGRTDAAAADLNAALTQKDAPAWILGRTHVELARLAAGRGDREAARREARQAAVLCEQGNDPACVDAAKRIR